MYRAEGYCYHSFLRPLNFSGPVREETDEQLFVESKPKEAREPQENRGWQARKRELLRKFSARDAAPIRRPGPGWRDGRVHACA